jgi:hypothetical protein
MHRGSVADFHVRVCVWQNEGRNGKVKEKGMENERLSCGDQAVDSGMSCGTRLAKIDIVCDERNAEVV